MCSAEHGRRGSAGFTLVEVMVAMMITGILATVIFQLVQGQGRFVAMQSGREEVQDNARGALELIASELRSLPAEGILSADSNSIRFRLPRAWGVLCDAPAALGGFVGVAFPDSTFPVEFPSPFAAGDSAWMLGIPTVAGGTGGPYVQARITGVAADNGSCAANLGLAPTSPATRQRFNLAAPSGATVAGPGEAVFLFQTVAYDVGTSSGSNPPGVWLRRRQGFSSPDPLAGPLQAADGATTSPQGLRFTYFCGGQALTPSQILVPANLATVDRIRIKVAVQSRNRTRSGTGTGSRETQTDSVTVHLRNNPGGAACPM
ncbi:MAG TPA: prepilin-type N-terminal cleavage/methylation domain-containing protein [Longimicrobiaceae bacterium]|nr:prepilin-type N-terminal cleavage/methylation domain-containing protein [Longimicrobiaceae bacterium]